MKKIITIITILFNMSNFVFAREKREEIIYTPMSYVGTETSYGNIFAGDILSTDDMTLEYCKEYVKDNIKDSFIWWNNYYLSKKEKGDKNAEHYKPMIIGESSLRGVPTFCWPSDANEEEKSFFRENGYISPQTKDKIFPLGERKYTDEPKPTMELIK